MREEKLETVKEHVSRLMYEHRRAVGAADDEATPLEMEAAVSDKRSAAMAVVQGLTQLAMQDPQLAPSIEKKMAEAGIQPPGVDEMIDEIDEVDLSQYE